MSRTILPAKRLLTWASAFLFAATVAVTAIPQTVFAAGERFEWSSTDNAIINVTGGDLNPSTMRTDALQELP